MRQCSVSNLKTGMMLGQHLHAYYGGKRTLLLGRGAKITGPVIDKLTSIGYPFVYIEEEGTEEVFPDDVLSEETRDRALLAISQYYEEIKNREVELSRNSGKPVDILKSEVLNINPPRPVRLKESVRDILQDLFLIGSVRGYETMAGLSRTNAIHNHVLNVAVISLLIGWQCGYFDSEQIALGMGALLHDVGKSVLPGIYEKRSWELNPEERALVRHHPVLGEKLLRGDRAISEVERQIIIQHHERQDGTGYPFGLVGNNQKPVRTHYSEPNHIFRFAEIVAVANAFDNLVSGNTRSRRFSPEEALDALAKEAGTRLNVEIVKVLASVVTLYPVGSNVRVVKHLDSRLVGTVGVVAKSDEQGRDEIEIIVLFDQNGKRISARKLNVHLNEKEGVELIMSY